MRSSRTEAEDKIHLATRPSHLLMCLAVLAYAGLMLPHRPAAEAEDAPSFRDLRYRGTIPQTTDYSCGAAAVACLLQVYYGIPATEEQILELAEDQMIARGEEPGVDRGLTAYDLRAASGIKGLPLAGYGLTLDELADYFQRGGLPLIAHVTRPQLHYLIVLGMASGHIMLADPGWGRTIVPLEDLEGVRAMSGVVLVPLPNAEQTSHVRREQELALEWMRSRLSQLGRMRERMP